MTEIESFKDINSLINKSRKTFEENLDTTTHDEIERLLNLCFKLLRLIPYLYPSIKTSNEQKEETLCVIIQIIETTLPMYYLSESGYWDVSLTLKRNISELFAVAIAIGYDGSCYSDWKDGKNSMNRFDKIIKRILNSHKIPETDKSLTTVLKRYWNESSQFHSHNIVKKSIRIKIKSGQVQFEPKIAHAEFQKRRLRTIRNIILNVLSIIVGIYKFDKINPKEVKDFPELSNVLKELHKVLSNKEWLSQATT